MKLENKVTVRENWLASLLNCADVYKDTMLHFVFVEKCFLYKEVLYMGILCSHCIL